MSRCCTSSCGSFWPTASDCGRRNALDLSPDGSHVALWFVEGRLRSAVVSQRSPGQLLSEKGGEVLPSNLLPPDGDADFLQRGDVVD